MVARVREASRYRRTKIGIIGDAGRHRAGFIGPLVAPYQPDAFVGKPFMKPTAQFLLGTDFRGRDLLSPVALWQHSVVWVAFAAASIGMVLGVTVGLVPPTAGLGGRVPHARHGRVPVDPLIIFVLLFVSLIGAPGSGWWWCCWSASRMYTAGGPHHTRRGLRHRRGNSCSSPRP